MRQTSTRREFLGKSGLMAAAIASPLPLWAEATGEVCTFDVSAFQHLDITSAANRTKLWDTFHVLSALQGLANRISPSLYVFYISMHGINVDRFWFDWMQQKCDWPASANTTSLHSIEDVVLRFRDRFKGLVVYDPLVPATSNLASTIAGCADLLPVRFDSDPVSLFHVLSTKLNIPIGCWLVNSDGSSKFTGKGIIPDINESSSGSAKIDAYLWAIRLYLQSGKCDPSMAAYYIDSFWLKNGSNSRSDMHTLTNHDYFISNRAFFFDLSPWGDEQPNDDPAQRIGADRHILITIFSVLSQQMHSKAMIKVGGFPPWPFKYTSSVGCKHAGVPTENEFACVISQFNGYMEADAAGLGAMANASFYRHLPLPSAISQPNPKPTSVDWVRRGHMAPNGTVARKIFMSHYVGDYDSPSWLYQMIPSLFRDLALGSVPLNWAIDPNLSDRAPQALLYAYQNATANDYFITGDSGAGYINPRALSVRPDSKLSSGLSLWMEHCRKYYARWDMSITGFIIDGVAGASTDKEFAAYRAYSRDGIGTQDGPSVGIRSGVAICREHDLPDDVDKAAALIAILVHTDNQPVFLWLRSVLKNPSWYLQLSKLLRSRYPDLPFEVVDAYTFFGLIGKSNEK